MTSNSGTSNISELPYNNVPLNTVEDGGNKVIENKIQNELKSYALLEVFIGLFGLVLLFFLPQSKYLLSLFLVYLCEHILGACFLQDRVFQPGLQERAQPRINILGNSNCDYNDIIIDIPLGSCEQPSKPSVFLCLAPEKHGNMQEQIQSHRGSSD